MADFPQKLKDMGYTEEELEKDNPYTQWERETEVTESEEEAFNSMKGTLVDDSIKQRRITDAIEVKDSDFGAFDEAVRFEKNRTISAPLTSVHESEKELRTPLVIYHGNCADGFAAAWVFHYVTELTGQQFEYHFGVHGEAVPDVTGRTVYIVDFSYPKEQMREIRDKCTQLIWIDHHLSAAKEHLTGDMDDIQFGTDKVFVLHDLEMSGATLAWRFWEDSCGYLMGQRPPLLGHIEDRDLWRFKLAGTENIQANVFSFEYSFEKWDQLMAMNEAQLLSFSVAGAAITRKHHKDIAELVKICKRMVIIGGWEVPVASLSYTMSSDACHKMAEEFRGGDRFAACYWDTADSRKFSLRSTENGMDVSLIAKQYGGGGHKHAAGFSVPRDHYLAVF